MLRSLETGVMAIRGHSTVCIIPDAIWDKVDGIFASTDESSDEYARNAASSIMIRLGYEFPED